jgi:acetyl esterase/lipase
MRPSRYDPRPLSVASAIWAAFSSVACSPLQTFDSIVPKDRTSVQAAASIFYGEGARRTLDVYTPRGGAKREHGLPVIVFFYGGSWNGGSRTGYAFVGRALAARGFVAIIPDYRLVPQVRYPAFVEDGAAAVEWARAHARDYGGDPDRIVLAGHSAGAYIAAMLAVDDRWLGASRRSVKGFIGLAGPYDFAPFDVSASREAFGQWPKPEETQPVTWAGAGDPPSLLLLGAKDIVVRPANSEALAAKLRAGGVAVRIETFANLGHVGLITALAMPFRGRARVLPEMVAFARQVTTTQQPGRSEARGQMP